MRPIQQFLVLARIDLRGFGAGFSGSASSLDFCEHAIDSSRRKFVLRGNSYSLEFLDNAFSHF